MPTIPYEQAVYGTFPFWERGYDVLARSPGCRADWVEDFRRACQRIGERPQGAGEAGGLFALRLSSGPWAIVGMSAPGHDDRGRPGALAFHALFVAHRDYRRAGADPFAFAGLLRDRWTADTALASGRITIQPDPDLAPPDARADAIAAAIGRGRRVAIEAAAPIDELARRVWRRLSPRARLRASVATWAFGAENRFDLVGLPRLAGLELDTSYVDPDAPPPTPGRRTDRLAGAAVGLLAILAVLSWWLDRAGPVAAPSLRVAADAPAADIPTPADRPPPPDRAGFADRRLAPEEARLVADGLADLAARFEVDAGEPGGDPAERMIRLAERLRYRGPRLTDDERAALAREPGPATASALAADAHIRRFVADRPLPADFRRGPLRWQLEALAWSFHTPIEPGRTAAEIPYDLADALARPAAVAATPGPLADRYPALADYARFLARLPRR